MKFIALLLISFTTLAQMGTCPINPNGINDLIEEQPVGSGNWIPLCNVSIENQRNKVLETNIIPGEEIKSASLNLKYAAINTEIALLTPVEFAISPTNNENNITFTILDSVSGSTLSPPFTNSSGFAFDTIGSLEWLSSFNVCRINLTRVTANAGEPSGMGTRVFDRSSSTLVNEVQCGILAGELGLTLQQN